MPNTFTRYFANSSVEFKIQEDNEIECFINESKVNIFPVIYEMMENILILDTKGRQIFDEMIEDYINKQLEREEINVQSN